MSYPYGQYPGGDNYSTPSTPHDAFPQWDTIEREQQDMQDQQQQQHQQQHQQSASTSQQPTVLASDLHSPIPGGFPPTIHLEETPPIVPSHDDSVLLHQVQRSEPRQQNKPQPVQASGSMVIRSGRAQQHQHVQQQAHPYRRSSASSSTTSTARQQPPQLQHQISVFPVQPSPVTHREQIIHFAPAPLPRQKSGGVVASAIPSTSSARASPLVPSPSSRVVSFGSPISNSPIAGNPPAGSALLRTSPRTMDPPPLPTPAQVSAKPKPYIIRMDTHYDTDTHVLTAVLEVPGVKREHLTVKLSTCAYNRVRQITVTGAVYPPLGIQPLINPAAAATPAEASVTVQKLIVRERKFGTFHRVIPVPADLKCEDIEAKLEDGILFLRFPCGVPAEEDGENVAVF
ncbi:hypothetical protein FA15DRAFT_665201 [Coprinopsis marcescibilis]|uniref:SHSP domain-containing protein n=1 Tax=Coprinopsis marcescibilis TaxID=230819 RepID=A0A5C3L779_COPMA|nr:hypothetical protein FA15DRAFT_665201 [Coprinopsis marcescibilis]